MRGYSGVRSIICITRYRGDNPTEPSFAGRFAEIQVQELSGDNAVSTFIVMQVGPGGLAFYTTFLLVLDVPNGAEISVFNVAF